MKADHHSVEKLNQSLNDPETLRKFKEKYDGYKPGFFPRMLGNLLIWTGNKAYGEKPSYLKFRAIEVIARVPYHSWSSAVYTWLTLFYTDEKNAIKYSNIAHFSEHAQENETMHVVVISNLARGNAKANMFFHTFVPMFFAFFYFWASYWMYILSTRSSYELNYLFEQHAYDQYDEFLTLHEEALKARPLKSEFLEWYGRKAENHYEFFQSIRNDEIIHRNQSIEEIEKLTWSE